jgi:hypothetical protein
MTTIIRLSLFAILELLLAGAASAEPGWDFVNVDCNPAKQEIVITPDTLADDAPALKWFGTLRPPRGPAQKQHFRITTEIDYGECLLAANLAARVKMAVGKTLPYGMCGGSPEIWLSLWFNQRKWFSKKQISGHCPSTVMTRIVISPTHMVWCEKPSEDAIAASDALKNAKETCSTTPASQLPQQRDALEYPQSGTPPTAGTIVIEHSQNPTLCAGMIKKENTRFHLASWSVVPPPMANTHLENAQDQGQYGGAGHFSRNRFDINNDGAMETVYGFHPENHAHDADVYFAAPGTRIDKMWPKISDQTLWQASTYVFPSGFARCNGHACGMDDLDGLLYLKNYTENGHPFSYRLRYLHAAPMVFKGATYFLLTSLESDREHITALVKPKGQNVLEETCIFRTVQENY